MEVGVVKTSTHSGVRGMSFTKSASILGKSLMKLTNNYHIAIDILDALEVLAQGSQPARPVAGGTPPGDSDRRRT